METQDQIKAYIAPADAAQAIQVLRLVHERLIGPGSGNSRLRVCLDFAQEAVWAAAYPDDPLRMLDMIANQAENALG